MIRILFFSLFVSSYSFGQTASFKEIRLKPNLRYYNTKDTTIIYPLVVTKNRSVTDRINNTIRDKVITDYDKTKSLKRNILDMTSDGTINMSYEVTFNKSGILSMNIFREGCGAYCSSGNDYFNFDLITGKELELKDLLYENKIDSFTKVVKADKIHFLEDYKKEEKDLLVQNEIDSSTYDWAIEEVNNYCINSISIDDFVLSANAVEIMDPCGFPNAIKSQTPTYELKYPYTKLSSLIRPDKKKKLIK